ncbi:PIG-L deacetylase family protein [Fulvimarina sp. MAC8]|uniref:PIG-L deacetylase family protein n=1 Tax=Fulvimarina sp. MAC8 TaxID=3162874 RepID=UPI0032EE9887
MTTAHDPRSLQARRILIVAPHPDDESLGCGGLASILAADGRQLHTLFVTDGGASHSKSDNWPRPRLAAEREVEACRALDALGLGQMPRTFLRLRDANMPVPDTTEWRSVCEGIGRIVEAFEPELVLLPWRRDPHCDHRASWQLVTAAMKATECEALRLEYAIWLDEFGTPEDHPRPGEMMRLEFDVSTRSHLKRFAVAEHRTQTTSMISDDPTGFRLEAVIIARLTGPTETYWQDEAANRR